MLARVFFPPTLTAASYVLVVLHLLLWLALFGGLTLEGGCTDCGFVSIIAEDTRLLPLFICLHCSLHPFVLRFELN
jgi:hypothetical protein